jgi:YVTN family beta-propeller protein
MRRQTGTGTTTFNEGGGPAIGFALTLVLAACGAGGGRTSQLPATPMLSVSPDSSVQATASVAPELLEPTDRIDVGDGASLILFHGEHAWVAVESGVVRIDPDTDEAVEVIGGLTPPYGFNVGFGSAWISRADEEIPRGWIERYDLESGELLASIDVGLMPLETITAFDSIWVPNHHSSSVSRIDPTTNEVIATIEVEGGHGDPYGLAADSRRLWTSSPNGGHISGIDPATNEVVEEVAAWGCGIVAAAGRVWWHSSCKHWRVRAFDAAEPSAIEEFGSPPAGMPVTDGQRVWAVAFSEEGGHLLLTPMDPETLAFGMTIDTGVAEPEGWAVGFGTLWVSKGNEIIRFDL